MNLLEKIKLLKSTWKSAYFSWYFEYKENQLFNSIVNNDLDEAKWLVSRGANINYQDSNKDTALHYAINSYRMDLIKPLLELGADINITNSQGITPLMSLCKLDYDTYKYNPRPLLDSASEHILSFLDILIEAGADINTVDNHSHTAILYSLLHHNSRITKKLIDIKANLHIKDHRGQDFVDELCYKKDYELLTYLCHSSDTKAVEDITERLEALHSLKKLSHYEQQEYANFKQFIDGLQRKNKYEEMLPEKTEKPKKKVKI
jgi:ankyrin repeat protein